MIGRWGGGEFLVFVPVAPADRLEEIVMRVLRTVSEAPVIYQCNEIRITGSTGSAPTLSRRTTSCGSIWRARSMSTPWEPVRIGK